MKHIDSYSYKKIDSHELESFGCLPFSKEDINKISKLMGREVEYNSRARMIRLGYIVNRGIYGWTHIFQKPDEWFYIFSIQDDKFTSSYKCDQLDGLFDCLNQIYKSKR